MDSKKEIRIALIVGKWIGGGVESCLMNYFRYIDKSKFKIDFIVDDDSTCTPIEEINKLGGKVIFVPPYQNIHKYIPRLIKIFRENKYDIVHSNINSLSVFPLLCAYIAKVPVRIAHSHSTTNRKEWKKNILKGVLKPFSKVFANRYFACTEHAGRWLFGDKTFDKGNVKIVNNAIELNRFEYNEDLRKKIRKRYNLENKFVIGNIGRFIPQKNHERIIEIFNEFQKENHNTVLLLIGEGELKEDILSRVKKYNIEDKVLFLGQRKDVNELFQAMDLFLFPSLYEGLGMVLIEAQCSNLPCIASSEVPKIARINDNVEFIDLNKDNQKWIEVIKKYHKAKRKTKIEAISNAHYNIENEVAYLEELYLK